MFGKVSVGNALSQVFDTSQSKLNLREKIGTRRGIKSEESIRLAKNTSANTVTGENLQDGF